MRVGPTRMSQHLLIWVWELRLHIERFLRVVFAYRKSLRPPMLLLSLKAGSHLWSSLNHALCGSVRYRSVSLDPMRVPHCCPLYGVPTRPKLNTASLQTEMRARAVNCCLAYYGCRYRWVRGGPSAMYGDRSRIWWLPSMLATFCSLRRRYRTFQEGNVSYSGVQLRQGRRRAYISGETSIAVGDILLV